MNAEAVLKQRVRNEQTSGEKKSPSKGVLIFLFFSSPDANFQADRTNFWQPARKG
jgi:hypothetical protein